MKILITGGRDFTDYDKMNNFLSYVDKKFGIDLIINGGAKGADSLSTKWANENKKPYKEYLPDWNIGKQAGILRNIKMLDDSKPDIVVAFRGGNGTKHMTEYATKQGYKVYKVK